MQEVIQYKKINVRYHINRMMGEKPTWLSQLMYLTKSNTLSSKNTLRNLGKENFLNMVKGIYEIPTGSSIVIGIEEA
jgi:hypothetical protein